MSNLNKKRYKNNAISGSINMTTKQCCKCKLIVDINSFGKLKSSKDGYRFDCKTCRKKYREETKEQLKVKQKEYYDNHTEILKSKNKEYRLKNSTTINNQRKEYRNRPEVKEHIKVKNKEYLPTRKNKIKEQRKTDKDFQIKEILRSKIHKMIKGKSTSFQNLIGCDLDFLKKWIEFRFEKNMTWENLGSYWHFDHILPLNAFDVTNEKEKQICFHWTNLQPLEKHENQSKSDHLQVHYYFNNIVNINRFNSKNSQYFGYQMIDESLSWLRNKLRYGENPTDISMLNARMDNQQPSL